MLNLFKTKSFLTLVLIFSSFIAFADDFDKKRPAGVDDKQWSSLKSAVQEAKLLPTPEGIGGEGSHFGYAVSVDGDRALVGAPNAAGCGAAIVMSFNGTDWQKESELIPVDGYNEDKFGYSVSLSGNRALVGAYLDDDNGVDSGSVYIFDFDGDSWIQTQKLIASDGTEGDNFGNSISLIENKAVVGAYHQGGNVQEFGAAYVFVFDGNIWSETQKLVSNNRSHNDEFGNSVSMSGDKILIGAKGDSTNGSFSGSAYVFRYDGNNWLQSQKLIPSDNSSSDFFGYSVSLSGDKALIGASWDDDKGSASGSAYIYEYIDNIWIEKYKLTASDGAQFTHFGNSVYIFENRALIGAYKDSENGSYSGASYMFELNNGIWLQTQKITPEIIENAGDQFGISVSLSENFALIGAHENDFFGGNSGSAYIYTYDGNEWMQNQQISIDGSAWSYFGNSISLFGNYMLIGAPHNRVNDIKSGSAYLFAYNNRSWKLIQKIFPDDAGLEDYFGASVSMSDSRLLIGSPRSNGNQPFSGSAYIFEYDENNWIQSQKLTAFDGISFDEFGYSVSLAGNRALIGSPSDDDFGSISGSAHIFEFNGDSWIQTQKIIPEDGGAGDQFGKSVSLNNSQLMIGSPGEHAAYIFNYFDETWIQNVKLSGSYGSGFGSSLSLSDNRALIGSSLDYVNGIKSGSAYIYDLVGGIWIESHNISSSGASDGDAFGYAVSLKDDRIVIGSPNDDNNDENSGAAYLFEFDGTNWIETQKIIVKENNYYDSLGSAVSLSSHHVSLGALYDDDHGTNSGSAYVYKLIDDLVFKNSFEYIEDLIFQNGFEEIIPK